MKIVPFLIAAIGFAGSVNSTFAEPNKSPVPLIFDTDIGNDVDDVLALGMIHSIESLGECKLLAVTITKDHPSAAAFTDAVNTFYGRGDIPIGVCDSGVTSGEGKFLTLADKTDDGSLRFPHDLKSGADAPAAVNLLRKTLAAADDNSVAIAQVGFSTNLANLLSTPPDQYSSLSGTELVKKKVKVLSIMGGAFAKIPGRKGAFGEYNIIKDLAAAKKISEQWPTSIVWSGYEIGISLPYPHESIEKDFSYVAQHPLSEAYFLYSPPPHDRPTWDLTSVLYAIRPDASYFDLSPPGTVTVNDQGHTTFTPSKDGRDRFLMIPEGGKSKILKTLVDLSSQAPNE